MAKQYPANRFIYSGIPLHPERIFFSGPSLVVDLVVDSRLIMLIPSRFLGQKSISLAKKKSTNLQDLGKKS